MKIKEIRNIKTEQLEKELEKFRKELFEVAKEIRDGKEKNVRKSLRIKRIIARIQTVLNERREK
jgi:large subunit ribosomal protein L29